MSTKPTYKETLKKIIDRYQQARDRYIKQRRYIDAAISDIYLDACLMALEEYEKAMKDD